MYGRYRDDRNSKRHRSFGWYFFSKISLFRHFTTSLFAGIYMMDMDWTWTDGTTFDDQVEIEIVDQLDTSKIDNNQLETEIVDDQLDTSRFDNDNISTTSMDDTEIYNQDKCTGYKGSYTEKSVADSYDSGE